MSAKEELKESSESVEVTTKFSPSTETPEPMDTTEENGDPSSLRSSENLNVRWILESDETAFVCLTYSPFFPSV